MPFAGAGESADAFSGLAATGQAISAEHWATLRQMDRFQHSGGSVHCERQNRHRRRAPHGDRNDIGHGGRDTDRRRIRLRRLRLRAGKKATAR